MGAAWAFPEEQCGKGDGESGIYGGEHGGDGEQAGVGGVKICDGRGDGQEAGSEDGPARGEGESCGPGWPPGHDGDDDDGQRVT